MNRIDLCFGQLRESGEGALVAFLVAGDPNFEEGLELAEVAVKAGADLLELGMPFSDAMADGPAVQRAYGRALRAGMTLARVVDFVRALRRRLQVPIVLMGYLNPILAYGPERFARDFRDAGGDGVLIVDLPPEEEGILNNVLPQNELYPIYLVSPTTDTKRVANIAKNARGYLYYISLEGVTGSTLHVPAALGGRLKSLRRQTKLPITVGFGIRTPQQVAALAASCEGVVVGSALLDQIEGEDLAAAKQKLGALVKSLKAPLRRS